ncbi:MAG: ATP-binding cassette domain-containing protein [Chlorobium limicola]|mgnify:CR=1 FL=1|jgi:putative ABC transport system ATP-binding protein|nr:ATP-binding cassette domain-containing protein [Chlorobium limicola]
MNHPLLEIKNLSFTYEGASVPVFERLDLTVESGAFILIKGTSGTGKSTLLRLVCRLNKPQGGSILFRNRDITLMPPAELRSSISYVAQVPQLVDAQVGENLLLPFAFRVNKNKALPRPEDLRAMLDEFYLDGVTLEQSALKLSAGQKQRLAIMRSILQQPDMMLLDEPTSALDPESAAMVFSITERLNTERKMTIMTVTHSDYRPETLNGLIYRLENRTLTLMPE